ncbi:condensation domain-containing protein, partial [Duganella sp. Leaf61]|uniref:condensation domain-containing protein n=1 Tax=Duganella sp. Leaf61 TaxID=1736227 RepID=UPI0035A318DF
MDIAHIHDQAAQRGIHLYLEDERLRFRADPGAMDQHMRDLLAAHKVELIAYLGQLAALRGQAGPTLAPIVPVAHAGQVRPSYGQEQLMFLDQLSGGKNNYNIPVVYRVTGPLDRDALRAAFATLLERHEILRTRFHANGGDPCLEPVAAYEAPFHVVDLRGAAAPQEAVVALANRDAAHRFDIARDVLVRLTVAWLSDTDHVLMFNTHHIVSDGWSIGIFMGELAALYNAGVDDPRALADLSAVLAPLPVQYSDYAAWQRQMLDGAPRQQLLGYWKRQLDGLAPGLNLPFDTPRDAAGSFRSGAVQRSANTGLTAAIHQLCKRHNITLFMFLQSALTVLLHRYSGDTDIPVGTAVAGRSQGETEGLIGFFVNTVVLRSDLSGDPTFIELARRNRRMILEGFAHQQLPFPLMVEELNPLRDTGSSPFFQVMLILQNNAGGGTGLRGLTLEKMGQNPSVNKFDLELDVTDAQGRLHLGWTYNAALFAHGSIARMASNFEQLLRAIVAVPDARIGALPVLADDERHTLLHAWNDTDVAIVAVPDARIGALPVLADDERHTLLHAWNDTDVAVDGAATLAALFEAQAAATPHAPALVDGADTLDYA